MAQRLTKPVPKARRKAGQAPAARKRQGANVRLLSGGNPQIAKADGAAPVRAYLAAMPGWKRAVGRRLDALIGRHVPAARKAVRWNTPFYGVAGQGWFLAFHCLAKHVKVAFFRGADLRPPPPGKSKDPRVRYLDIREPGPFDEERLADWIRQAAALPGPRLF